MSTEGKPRFLPVSFYDGNHEFNIGQIKLHPSLDYKALQSLLSQRIGISPNQMSIYLVDINNTPKRKTLVTNKASFNLILQEQNCTLLVILKRSRNRRRKSKPTNSHTNPPLAPHNFNHLSTSSVPGFVVWPALSYYDRIAVQEFEDYNNRVRNLYNYYPVIEEPCFVPERWTYSYCDECIDARRQGKTAQFHLCVNDAVTAWFRTPAGPIARPGG
ncbi:hypothetical protein DCAR_0310378 [Daucus carota subsp. sativus]|uniref:DUF7138 domain-containing protein n=1 Tax=Daucus carota subsp. sativus TaxID=79200 RepID=A0A165ZTY5_DAUCS|nr:hypothetical protein DCAR_0310378 [Daucus carota subsp. sativus]